MLAFGIELNFILPETNEKTKNNRSAINLPPPIHSYHINTNITNHHNHKHKNQIFNTYTLLSVQRYCSHHPLQHSTQYTYNFLLDVALHLAKLNHHC